MFGWLNERFGSLFRTKSETAVEDDCPMDVVEAAVMADYAALKEHFDCFRESGMLKTAIDFVMTAPNWRYRGLRELLLDTDLLKRIDAEGELRDLVIAVKEDGVWEDAFRNFMHSFGDRVADSIACDLFEECLEWLPAAMPRLVTNLLACEGDEATECLVLLGAAFPEAAIRSRKLVEAVRADPGAAERAKARLAAQAPIPPSKAVRAAAKADAFMRMALKATVFAVDLPTVRLHGATAAASHPVSEPEKAFLAAECADHTVLKERFDYFKGTGTLDAAIHSVIADGQNRGLGELLLDIELLKQIDEAGLLDYLIAAVKMSEGWDGDNFPILVRVFGDRVADTVAHDVPAEFERQAGAI